MSEQQPRLSRRHVVRAGAWSVPAVSVAVAAPAFAASPPGALIFNTYQANGSDYVGANPTTLVTQFQLGNTTGTAITGITLVVTLPLSRVTAAAPTALTGANWSYTSTTTTATTVTHTFSYGATVPGFGNTGGMSFKVLLVAPPGTGISISAVGSAPGAGSTSVSFVSGG